VEDGNVEYSANLRLRDIDREYIEMSEEVRLVLQNVASGMRISGFGKRRKMTPWYGILHIFLE
jgi:hypothetical protein